MNIVADFGFTEEALHVFISKAFGAGQVNEIAVLNKAQAAGNNLQTMILVQNQSVLKGNAPYPQCQKHQGDAPAPQEEE